MTALFSLADILMATGGSAAHVASKHITGISIDSREISPGDLFVAIMGDRFDGHDFVAKAIENGAAAALVSAEHAKRYGGLPIIVVADALDGLVALAKASRARSTATFIAITGSAGKTTTKEAVRTLLSLMGKTHASIRSFNNHWGVPLMLARMPADAVFGVFELGMNAPGEIAALSKLVQPDIAVITTIAPAHLEMLGSLANIARAKAEIFSSMRGGVAILNVDHAETETLFKSAQPPHINKVRTYGFADSADVRISNADQTADGMSGQVSFAGEVLNLSIASAGKHRLANAVAAFVVAMEVGMERAAAIAALKSLHEPEGRGAVDKLGADDHALWLVDESYNANPVSMGAALDVFAGVTAPGGKRVLVLGDMLELGETAHVLHEELYDSVKNAKPDMIFLVGEHMAMLGRKLGATMPVTCMPTASDIIEPILKSLDYGDLIMVKASNSVRLGSVVTRIRDRFSKSVSVE